MNYYTPKNSVIELAKTCDPSGWLLQHGYTVVKSSSGNDIYVWLSTPISKNQSADIRISRKTSKYHSGYDVYLCCWKNCLPIGKGSTNIDLAIELSPVCRKDLVKTACEICAAANIDYTSTLNTKYKFLEDNNISRDNFKHVKQLSAFPSINKDSLTIPQESNKDGGRNYLLNRGISLDVIIRVEQEKIIHYLDDGILFLGRDNEGKIRSATKRAIYLDIEPQKRDLLYSQKCYPPIIQLWDKAGSLWIVEGFIDGLAVCDIALRLIKAKKLTTGPCVIVTGGCRNTAWINNISIREILKQIPIGHLFISLENDLPEKATIKYITKQVNLIKTEVGVDIKIISVPKPFKDLADYNLGIKKATSKNCHKD